MEVRFHRRLSLPVRWRTVLSLTAVEGLSPAEVGRRTGLTPAAVAAVAYRSRRGLRRADEELDGDEAGELRVPSQLTVAA